MMTHLSLCDDSASFDSTDGIGNQMHFLLMQRCKVLGIKNDTFAAKGISWPEVRPVFFRCYRSYVSF